MVLEDYVRADHTISGAPMARRKDLNALTAAAQQTPRP
jgi:hypothetical protein